MAQDKEFTSLKKIIDELKTMFEGSVNPEYREKLDEIESNHERLMEYRLKGIKDNKRDKVYGQLLESARCLRANYFMDLYCARPGYREARIIANRIKDKTPGVGYIKEVEERFNHTKATIATLPKDEQEEASRNLHEEHFRDIEQIFCFLLTSYQWTEAEAEDYLTLFLSPACDPIDVQVMISALTLNVMRVFDAAKAWMMGKLYLKGKDEYVKQRAFVGWAFSLPITEGSYNKKYNDLCNELIASEEVAIELEWLQTAYLQCMDIEKDSEKLEKDILPRILRNAPIDITPTGIKEKSHDSIDDILNPDNEEKRLKRMESYMKRIEDMKNNGADVYYASFSRLKGDSFFRNLVNWFMPFYKEHPMIRTSVENLKDNKIFDMIQSRAEFCDSDCYSFVIGASSVFKNIPEDMREAFLASEIPNNKVIDDEHEEKVIQINKKYLHDLFRFARLNPLAKYIINPFDKLHTKYPVLFFHHWKGSKCIDQKLQVAYYLLRQKKYHDFRRVMSSLTDVQSYDYLAMYIDYYRYLWDSNINAYLEMKDVDADRKMANALGDKSVQVENFFPEDLKMARERFFMYVNAALSMDEEAYSIWRVLGRVQSSHGMLDEAVETFKHVLEMRPDDKKAIFDYASVLLKKGDADESANYVYRLTFEMPDDPDVMRLQAWLLLLRKTPEKAQPIYKTLLDNKRARINEDILNAGYCAWFLDKWEEAAGYFVTFMQCKENEKKSLHEFFMDDASILDTYEIDKVDQFIMEDFVRGHL